MFRTQRLFVEMVQMARRPFSTINLEIDPKSPPEDVTTISVSDTLSRRKKVSFGTPLFHLYRICDEYKYFFCFKEYPNPIAMEPCNNNKAAVLSLIVRLPTGTEAHSPNGQSGLFS